MQQKKIQNQGPISFSFLKIIKVGSKVNFQFYAKHVLVIILILGWFIL